MATIVYPDRAASGRHPRAEQTLARAATAARRAPVMGDERPWRWRLTGDRAELHLAGGWPASAGAGLARSLIDCGSALHHALVVLRGEGARTRVDRFPDPRRQGLLAIVRLDGFGTVTPAEVRTYRTVALRSTIVAGPDRVAVSAPARLALESAAAEAGARLRLIEGGPDDPGAGRSLIETDLGPPRGWLSEGEALSAVTLAAVEHGLAAFPGPEPVADRRGFVAVSLRLAVPDRRPVRLRH
jgi:hypothetical protein